MKKKRIALMTLLLCSIMVLIDGMVYILMPDGRMFNLQGAEVR